MADDPPPLQPDDAPADGPPIGAAVRIEGELQRHGKESHLVRFRSGFGVWQYVWIKPALIFPVDA